MLQKQNVHLDITGGLQKKDDEFLVIPSKLAVADNVQFDDASTIVRRGGQASLNLGAFNAIAVKRAFTHQGGMVLEQATQTTRAGAGGLGQVINPAIVDGFSPSRAARRAGMVTDRIASITSRNTAYGVGIPYYDGSFDCATVGNFTCYVFETRHPSLGTQTVRVVLVDDVNHFRVYDNLLTDGTKVVVKPRVVAVSSSFIIFVGTFTSGSNTYDLKSMFLSTAGTPTALSAAIYTPSVLGGTTEGTDNDQILYDVSYRSSSSSLGLVVRQNGGTFDITLANVNTSTGIPVASRTIVPSTRPTSITALCTNDGASYRIHAFYGIGTNVAKAASYNVTANSVSAETTAGTAAGGTLVSRLVAYENSASLIYLAFDAQSSAENARLRLSSFTHSYGSLSECAAFSPWFIAGRIASVDSRLYLPMIFMSAEYQTTTYVIDLTSALGNLGAAGSVGEPPHVIARIDYGEGAQNFNRRIASTRVPTAAARSNSLILPYLKYETNLRLVGTAMPAPNETSYALARATINLDSQLANDEANGVAFLAGACPLIYDGSILVEEGFHHAPECITVGAGGATGTYQFPADTKTYSFCFTMAWQDAQGNWHESGPSNTYSFTSAAVNCSITPTVLQPPSQKPGARLLLYRTKGSSTDTTMYLAIDYAGNCVINDTYLGEGEQLYTEGAVLPNTPAPACRHVSTFQKRLVLSGCGDGSRVYFSKVTTPGYGVEFSSDDPSHQQVISSDKGRVVGTKEMDGNLVVVCENAIGVISGNGPSDTGAQGQYNEFQATVKEVGGAWDSPKSIIGAPEGVWFRSPFGLRLVARSGSLGQSSDGKQAGAEVDSLVSGNVVAISGDAKQQIRFYQSGGTVLVWDYQWRQWTRFTGHANSDAVYADDRYYHLTNYSSTTPLVRYTDETATTDVNNSGVAASIFSSTIETPWLSFGGIQGFQRIYRLAVLGRTVDGSVDTQRFIYDFAYNFGASSGQGASFSVTPVSDFRGSGIINFEHHFETQKCSSLKITLTFRPNTGLTGRVRLTDLTLQVGVKGGYFKQPSAKRY